LITSIAREGTSNAGRDEVFDYLNDQIYQPLAFEPKKKDSLSDMILGILDLKDKKINDRGLSLGNFGGFQKSVMSTFGKIAAQSENVKDNEAAILDSSVDLLKKFHIYWNMMRSQGQIGRVKGDTKQVMQSLLMTYQVKRDFQNFVLKTLVKSIVKAYYRFMKAHKMVDVLSHRGHSMLARQIVARYKAIANVYIPRDSKHNSLARDIANFLYVLESFYQVSYKQGLDDSTMIGIFENEIVKAIQNEYLEYENMLNGEEENDRRIIEVRNFTAALLLKMKHQTYIIFNLNGISQFVNHSAINFINQPILVKLYYDLYDNFITIPRSCVSFLLLRHCYVYEITRTYRYLIGKYLFSRSTLGCRLSDIFKGLIDSISSKTDPTLWENWGLFKQYYYENLFSVLETFRSTYHINSMDYVENLENLLVSEIDKFREEQGHNGYLGTLTSLLQRLDKNLYSELIAIKSEYNQFAPVEKNPHVLDMIKLRLKKFFETVTNITSKKAQPLVEKLTARFNAIIEEWVKAAPTLPEVSYNIGNPSLMPTVQNMNLVNTIDGETLADASEPLVPTNPRIEQSANLTSNRNFGENQETSIDITRSRDRVDPPLDANKQSGVREEHRNADSGQSTDLK